MKECEVVLWVILSGLTWRLQQLDICINKVFKQCLINKYEDNLIVKNNIKVKKNVIIEWFDEWEYLDSVIINQMIFSSFKYSWIIFQFNSNWIFEVNLN